MWPWSRNCRQQKKPVEFIASAEDDLSRLPKKVKYVFGFALFQAQLGDKHPDAKPLKGYGGAGVVEVVENFDGNTYRAFYTVQFESVVYVLDAFQKKAKKGRLRQRGTLIASRAV